MLEVPLTIWSFTFSEKVTLNWKQTKLLIEILSGTDEQVQTVHNASSFPQKMGVIRNSKINLKTCLKLQNNVEKGKKISNLLGTSIVFLFTPSVKRTNRSFWSLKSGMLFSQTDSSGSLNIRAPVVFCHALVVVRKKVVVSSFPLKNSFRTFAIISKRVYARWRSVALVRGGFCNLK